MQIGRHHEAWAQVHGRREMYFACEVAGHEPNGDLTLPMRLLVNRGRDGAILKVRRHFREQVCGDQLYSSREAPRSKRTADGQTVHGVHVKSRKARNTTEKVERLLEAFIFIFVPFNDADNLSVSAVPWKRFRKAIGFLAVIFGGEHTRNNCNLGSFGNEFAHQLAGKTAVQ